MAVGIRLTPDITTATPDAAISDKSAAVIVTAGLATIRHCISETGIVETSPVGSLIFSKWFSNERNAAVSAISMIRSVIGTPQFAEHIHVVLLHAAAERRRNSWSS